MTGPQIFPILWGVLALALGSLFAFRPDIVLRMYEWNLGNYPLGRKLRKRMEPQPWMLVWYRVGGVFFILAGILVGTLGATGVIQTH